MLPFSSYTSRNIPIASLLPTPHVNFLTVRKSIVSGSANWHSLSAWICRRDPYFWEKMWQATQKKKKKNSYKWLILFKHVLPKEAAQLETLPEERIGSSQTTWELLAWSSTQSGGPAFTRRVLALKPFSKQAAIILPDEPANTGHWGVKKNHSSTLIVTSLSSWIILCLCCFSFLLPVFSLWPFRHLLFKSLRFEKRTTAF